MPKPLAILASLVLGAAAAGLVACGSGGDAGLLPSRTADDLLTNLERVEQLIEEGRCGAAVDAIERLRAQAEQTGPEVDPQLREALVDGTTRLRLLLEEPDGCEEEKTETETVPTETETTPAEEPTETAPPETEPPPTTTEPSQPGTEGGGIEPPAEEPAPEDGQSGGAAPGAGE